MDIVFAFQGEEVYRIQLPNNTISVMFDIDKESEVYNGINVSIPFIKNIQFKDSVRVG